MNQYLLSLMQDYNLWRMTITYDAKPEKMKNKQIRKPFLYFTYIRYC